MTPRMKNIIAWIVTILLAAWMTVAGIPKLMGPEEMLQSFDKWGYPHWFMYVVGIGEIAVAIGIFIPKIRVLAVGLLAVIMIGATVTHAMNDEISQMPPSLIALFMGILILILRRPSAVAPQGE